MDYQNAKSAAAQSVYSTGLTQPVCEPSRTINETAHDLVARLNSLCGLLSTISDAISGPRPECEGKSPIPPENLRYTIDEISRLVSRAQSIAENIGSAL